MYFGLLLQIYPQRLKTGFVLHGHMYADQETLV